MNTIISLKNITNDTINLLLTFEHSRIYELEIIQVSNGTIISRYLTGNKYPVSSRPIFDHFGARRISAAIQLMLPGRSPSFTYSGIAEAL